MSVTRGAHHGRPAHRVKRVAIRWLRLAARDHETGPVIGMFVGPDALLLRGTQQLLRTLQGPCGIAMHAGQRAVQITHQLRSAHVLDLPQARNHALGKAPRITCGSKLVRPDGHRASVGLVARDLPILRSAAGRGVITYETVGRQRRRKVVTLGHLDAGRLQCVSLHGALNALRNDLQ